ncbi:hypothetical protein STEG23_009100, partial [Scotinomys teguina]
MDASTLQRNLGGYPGRHEIRDLSLPNMSVVHYGQLSESSDVMCSMENLLPIMAGIHSHAA